MILRGMKPSSVTISNDRSTAPKEISELLGTHSINLIKRIHFADDRPLGVEESYIPISAIQSIDKKILEAPIYGYLENVMD